MKKKRIKSPLLTPSRLLVISYLLLVLLGTFCLSLPVAKGNSSFIDDFFHATSSLCVTGLTTFNIGEYSLFGQIVILLLIQIGGLGIMIITTIAFMLIGKRLSVMNRLVLSESINEPSIGKLVPLVRNIFLMTIIIELAGSILLSFVFIPQFGFAKGSYYALFHAISAFCNAGLDVLPGNTSLSAYAGNPLVNITISLLIFLGGIGYLVIFDIIFKKRWKKISLHSKIVLMVSLFLIVVSTTSYVLIEDLPGNIFEQILSAMFLSVSSRTAGFSTFDINNLSTSSRLMLIFNMFIGGSPSSTAGGIKTTTIFIILLHFIANLRSQKTVNFAQKTIPQKTIDKAMSLFFLSLVTLLIFVFTISLIEVSFSLEDIVFEVVSAFGTVGLSTGMCEHITDISKLLFILLMFAGRVGLLTIGMSIVAHKTSHIKYSEAKIMIG